MTTSDLRFFHKARLVASVSDCKVRVGCVAVYRGKIIGMGCNCNKTHPAQYKYRRFRKFDESLLPKLHAEIHCLSQISGDGVDFSKVKLYVYRIRNDQPFGLARPCPSCMAAILDYGIQNVYYTTNDGYAQERLENKRRFSYV